MRNAFSRHCSKFILLLTALLVSLHASALSQPKINASAWVLIEAESGNIIAEKNAHAKLPPASITKMMTTYVAYKAINAGVIALDDQVTVSSNAFKAGKGNSSKMFLREGEKVTVEELLKGIIIVSGNDASVALAEYTYQDIDMFIEKMNEYARKLGLESTYFKNSTGLPQEGHYSSPYDVAKIAQAIIKEFPEFYKTYQIKEYTHNDIRQLNRNSLLWRDNSIDGLKTGHTEEAGYCLVASGVRNGQRLISAVFDTDSKKARSEESQRLLNYGFRFFTTEKIYSQHQRIESARVLYGSTDHVDIGVTKDVYLTYPKEQAHTLTANIEAYQQIKAPIEKGQQLGTITVTIADKTLLDQPVYALNDVNRANFFVRAWQWLGSLFSNIL